LHELSITREILDIILDTAGRNNARSVESVNIELGQLSTFDEESIRFYFEFLSKGTFAEGAKLVFKRIPAVAKCKKCGKDFEPGDVFFSSCPLCGSTEYEVISGDTVKVVNMRIEE
jgi:hydrogenase nickel incorporation protein HypA/HybF